MKLDSDQVGTIRSGVGADPIPDAHAVMPDLVSAFGEHTFYLDQAGLVVWEWLYGPEAEKQPVVAVKLAGWADEKKTTLEPHKPEVTDTVVELTGGGAGKVVIS